MGEIRHVNEEDVDMKQVEREMTESREFGKGDELDQDMVRAGREEEVRYMIEKLDMFEFGTWEEAVERSGGKAPTTTKWVEGWKVGDDGERFVRSRLVGRDFKPQGEGVREDLFAAMPPLEAKKCVC